jgi:predicted nucleic acid-binding protein
MTRFVIDPLVAIRLAEDPGALHASHALVAPNSLRSAAMSILYRDVRAANRTRDEARTLLDPLTALKVRLLGDRVSRGTAWKIAEEQSWDDIHDAEYLAVTRLQADALVTLDDRLVRLADGLVPLAAFDALGRP